MKIEKGRDASKRLTVAIYGVKENNYSFLSLQIAKKFNLSPSEELIHSFSGIFQKYSDNKHLLSLDWDVWSGYMIVAEDKKSENLINEIYDWLMIEGIPQRKSFFAKFIQLIK